MMPTWEAAGIFAAWFLLQAALHVFVPGRIRTGAELPRGGRLSYKMNGLASLGISLLIVAALHFSGAYPLWRIHDQFGALMSVAILFAFVLSTCMYFYGKRTDPYKLSGNVIHDFWMGTGHNPRWPDAVRGFDFKFFCEAKPGLIGWMVINLAFALAQYREYQFVSLAMVLVIACHFLYVVNHFQAEPFILSTMDIKHEKFGFMLVFGDLVWVPFTYCLQGFYLIDHVHDLPLWGVLGIVALNLTGFYVFRCANLQKDRFKANPETARVWGRKAEYIESADGKKLLAAGFWRWSRHMNYLGDWIMAWAWSLPCLWGSVIPYFYPVYFGILLVQRERRNHKICSEKYGPAWDEYCKRVPSRIVPYVY